jgi:hypothetical protein
MDANEWIAKSFQNCLDDRKEAHGSPSLDR